MPQRLSDALTRFRAELAQVVDESSLYALQVRILGKKGELTELGKLMGDLSADQRREFGRQFNEVKRSVESDIESHRSELLVRTRMAALSRHVDLTALGSRRACGALHPITQTRLDLERVFERLGFAVADGPHVESSEYNFDKLNIAENHPARDLADTFFVHPRRPTDPELVLRTHTSPVQIRTMLGQRPPVRIIAPGTVFRRDDDATHSPMFHQIEGLYVDREVTMADLKATLYQFVEMFFGQALAMRFRPSYFPFVEPGAEFDVECPFCPSTGPCPTCKGSRFIELGGSGMVHPKVFEAVGYDPEEFSGWAFGFGIDRMAMLRYGVPDLRLFFEGDVRFLEQFSC